jgi:hypothetical protein
MHLPDDMILTLKRCNDSRNNVACAQSVENKDLDFSAIRFMAFFWVTHGEASSTELRNSHIS